MVRGFLAENVLESKLFTKITKGATTSKTDIDAYYAANLTQYQTPATRAVQEILVKNNQKLANQIYTQLQGGASFATLAKKYSKDPGSADKGGNFTATQGSDVPEFDAAVFAPTAKTGVLLKPVKTKQYGWFVIKPIASITPAKTTPEAKAEAAIKSPARIDEAEADRKRLGEGDGQVVLLRREDHLSDGLRADDRSVRDAQDSRPDDHVEPRFGWLSPKRLSSSSS